MVLNPLAGLLSKYQEKLDKLDSDRGDIIAVFRDIGGVTLTTKEFEIRDHILYLKTHSIKRQMVFFKKNEILAGLQTLPQKIVVDIK